MGVSLWLRTFAPGLRGRGMELTPEGPFLLGAPVLLALGLLAWVMRRPLGPRVGPWLGAAAGIALMALGGALPAVTAWALRRRFSPAADYLVTAPLLLAGGLLALLGYGAFRGRRWGAGPPLLLAGGVLLCLACWLRYFGTWLL